jgi:hemolysin III
VWAGAVAGVVITVFWLDAPRCVTAACYVAVGWIAVLAMPALWSALGAGQFALLAAGGVLYTMGSVVYASKRPDPFPHTFGYHEVFHALVITAVACHYVLITQLVSE